MTSVEGGASESRAEPPSPARGWLVVVEQEFRDLWFAGRGPILTLAFSLLLSVISYLAATNQELNLLDQKDTVNLIMQVTLGIGAALTLLLSADAISGERERQTLESLLLTPVPPRQIAMGKLLTVLSVWLVFVVVAVPYVWSVRVGAEIFVDAIAAGIVVGVLVAIAFASLGIVVSTFSDSNRVSLAVSAFVFIALLVPSQLPGGALKGWLGDLVVRVNPVASGAHFMDKVIVSNHAWTQEATWLVSPIVAALVALAAALLLTGRLRLCAGTDQ